MTEIQKTVNVLLAPGGGGGLHPGQLRDERPGDHGAALPQHDLPEHGQHGRLPRTGMVWYV